ncbi:hypothetical protein VNO80_21665 [Phaseolus coccineus]|uniref:Uncharacterized protein n=1 Tax=Phaseolus coccineus TaxID=3886 RepID=A0AAN9M8H2_PHACN
MLYIDVVFKCTTKYQALPIFNLNNNVLEVLTVSVSIMVSADNKKPISVVKSDINYTSAINVAIKTCTVELPLDV